MMINKKNILLVVDTQYDFMMSDGALYVPGSEEIIVPLIRYVRNLNPEVFSSVYFTMDTHSSETYKDSEEAKQFPPHCLMGTTGWSNVVNPGLIEDPHISVFVQHKGVFDMWAETNNVYTDDIFSAGQERDSFWEDIKPEVNMVYVCGVATDVCVYHAVAGLLKRGFDVVVLEDLTRGIFMDVDKFVLDFPDAVSTGQLMFAEAIIDAETD